MSLQKQVRIREVKARTTTRGDIYDLHADDNQEYATFDKGLALTAQSLSGPQAPLVTLTYTEKQKGQYTNRYAEKIEQAQTQLGVGQIAFGPGPAQALAPTVTQNVLPQLPVAAPPMSGVDKEMRIMRQTASKVAVHLLPYLPAHEQTPQGLLTMADFLVDYFVEGAPPATPIATTQAAFAQDPGVEIGRVFTDDDIPFLTTIDGLGN